jgi:hypothetical protein
VARLRNIADKSRPTSSASQASAARSTAIFAALAAPASHISHGCICRVKIVSPSNGTRRSPTSSPAANRRDDPYGDEKRTSSRCHPRPGVVAIVPTLSPGLTE